MDEASAATAAPCRALRRRYPWLVPGGLMLILAVLTINVLTDGPLIGADRRIREAVQAQANSATWRWVGGGHFAPAQLIVDLADPRVAVPALLLTALVVAARHRALGPLLTAGAAAALLLVIVVPAKILIGRPDPGQAVVAHDGLGAFPSGHTTTACVCYLVAVLVLAPDLPTPIRRATLAGLAALCVLVGAALLWCDFHWFTDVVAGWALAAIINQLALRLTGRKAGPGEPERPADHRASPSALPIEDARPDVGDHFGFLGDLTQEGPRRGVLQIWVHAHQVD